MNSQGPVAFRVSKTRAIALLFGSVALVACCLFTARVAHFPINAVGWFGSVFFAFAGLAVLKQLFDPRPALTVSELGFEAPHFRIPFVPWSEVEAFSVVEVKGTRFISVTLRNPVLFRQNLGDFHQALGALNKGMGFGDLSISAATLYPGFDELKRLFEKHAARRAA